MAGFYVRPLPGTPLWAISATYWSTKLNAAGRSVPGAAWDSRIRAFTGYPDAIEQVVARVRAQGLISDDGPANERDYRHNLPASYENAREYQKIGIDFLISTAGGGALLADEMGLGKAQAVDEPVLTPDGWRMIGRLRTGDHVIGADGNATRVEGVYPQGRKQVFRVVLTDGTSTICCAEHLWTVATPMDRFRGRPALTLPLAQLVAQGLTLSNPSNKRWFVPVIDAAHLGASTMANELHPYLLGALLANGHLSRAIQHTGSPDQWELINDVLPRDMFLVRRDVDHVNICPKDKFSRTNSVRDELKALGLLGRLSGSKFIPHAYLYASIESRVALLRGLFDNDGTVSKDGMTVEYNTVSARLAADVLELVRSLGAVAWLSTRIPTYTYKGERLDGQLDYRIRVSCPVDLVPFALPRKVERFKPRTKYPPAHAIDRVEQAGEAECVCIRVAASDGLYVTRDFIVTHNTFQTIKAARAFRRKTIIVCPAHVRGVWERPKDNEVAGGELAKWWPDAKVFKPYGTKPNAKLSKRAAERQGSLVECDVVVIHYDIIHAWLDVLLEWFDGGTIIFDEVQHLLNKSSRRSKACRALARVAKGRIGATGTPPTDRIRDLFNVVDTLSPGRFGGVNADGSGDPFLFLKRYADGHRVDVPQPGGMTKTVWVFEGKSNLPELRQRLDWFTLRRTKREVMTELPALTRQVVDIEITAKHRVMMNARLVNDKRRMRAALDAAADGKLKHTLALIREHLEAGQRVVVGTYRRAVCEKIAAVLHEIAPTSFIHGGVPLPNRGKIIDKLRKIEGPCALVANIDCASTGIDLTFASKVVMAELVWEPRDLIQFESRTHRYGAKDPVLVQYVIGRGTSDELILHGVINKLDNFMQLIENDENSGDGLRRDLTGDSEDEGLSRLAAALKKMGQQKGR